MTKIIKRIREMNRTWTEDEEITDDWFLSDKTWEEYWEEYDAPPAEKGPEA